MNTWEWARTQVPKEDWKFIPDLVQTAMFLNGQREELKKIPFKYASEHIHHQDRSSATVDGHKEEHRVAREQIKQFMLDKTQDNKEKNHITDINWELKL